MKPPFRYCNAWKKHPASWKKNAPSTIVYKIRTNPIRVAPFGMRIPCANIRN
jgi:hypothetical protein